MATIGIENFDLDLMSKLLFNSLKATVLKEKTASEGEEKLLSLELQNAVIFLDKEFDELTDYELYAMYSGALTIITKTLDRLQEITLARKQERLMSDAMFTNKESVIIDESGFVDKRRIK